MLSKQQKKQRSLIFTVAFHITVLLILFLFGFTTKLPLPEEEGIAVDFGDTDTGSGIIEPVQSNNTEVTQPQVVEESNMSQDYEEAPIFEKPKKEKPKTEPVKEETKEEHVEERVADANALYQNNSDNSNSSTSEGNAGGQGNQGNPNGNPDANNYNGTGNGGSGIGFSLVGRNPQALPKPVYTSNEQGIVVVKITVDREGKVISAIPGAKGSTTLDSQLLNAAKQAALNTKFNKKDSAPDKQIGTITYHFVLK
ncbi:MAG: energy transducer TonB [Bacteroidales bacterium]|nr:energy transducer TonB [Bacteroidales bacterium]